MFITRDPAGFVDGPNLYTYVRQNPWTAFDPHGLLAKDDPSGVVRKDHHKVTVESIKKHNFDEKLTRELENRKTPAGLWRKADDYPRHVFNSAHDIYNERSGKIIDQIVDLAKSEGIDVGNLSAKEAREIADQMVEQVESDAFNKRFNQTSEGVRESAGINRLGIENERVLQRKPSQ